MNAQLEDMTKDIVDAKKIGQNASKEFNDYLEAEKLRQK